MRTGIPRKVVIGGWLGGKPTDRGWAARSTRRRPSGSSMITPRMPSPCGRSPMSARVASSMPGGEELDQPAVGAEHAERAVLRVGQLGGRRRRSGSARCRGRGRWRSRSPRRAGPARGRSGRGAPRARRGHVDSVTSVPRRRHRGSQDPTRPGGSPRGPSRPRGAVRTPRSTGCAGRASDGPPPRGAAGRARGVRSSAESSTGSARPRTTTLHPRWRACSKWSISKASRLSRP